MKLIVNAIPMVKVNTGISRYLRCLYTEMERLYAEVLVPWCEQNIKLESLVVTDGWTAYNGLTKLGYVHHRILQSTKGKKTGVYLPMVHLIVSNLKRWLLGTHRGAVLPHHLPAYLNEFTFRFNRRFWRGAAFHRALDLITHAEEWPEYDTLYSVTKDGTGAWVHPKSSVDTRSKAEKRNKDGLLPVVVT